MTFRRTWFDERHPIVPALYFAGALGFCMFCFHPVYVGVALLAGLAYSTLLRGGRATVASLKWQLPFLVLIALINPLVSRRGTTTLFMLGSSAVHLEAFWYGLCMAELLVATVVWCSAAAQVMTSDKVTACTGRVAPVLGLTITMVCKLVPQFIRRHAQIVAVEEANTALAGSEAADISQVGAGLSARFERLHRRVARASRRMSVLMGWGMEDSLVMAASMRARAWGTRGRRTSYRKYRFTCADGVALGVLGAVGVVAVVGAARVCGPFQFYPALGPWTGGANWWAYAALVLYDMLPLLAEGARVRTWRRR